jgi:hypothetical protein
MRDFPAMEPDMSLFVPPRRRILPGLVILALCVFSAWMLWPSPGSHRKPRRIPPSPPPVSAQAAPVAPPLYVTVVPAADEGWCCAAGQLSAATRAGCGVDKGTFFAGEAEARKACPTAPSGSPRGRGKGA